MHPAIRLPSACAAVLLTLTGAACSGPAPVGPGDTTAGSSSSSSSASSSSGTPTTTGGGPSATSIPVAFRTHKTGQYLSATDGGGSTITATGYSVSPAEVFVLEDLDGGSLDDGNLVHLAAANGQYLSAVDGGGGALLADVSQPGDFETFVIQRLAGPGTIADGDEIALKAKLQVEYVSADQGGGGLVSVNEPHALGWETFAITLHPTVSPVVPAVAARAKVLAYLASITGNGTVAGQHNKFNDQPAVSTDDIESITGKRPGLWSADFGFGSGAVDNRAGMIEEAKKQWAQGAIVQLMYHNCIPTRDELCDWDDVGGAHPQHLSESQWSEIVTDGTPLNQAWKARLDTLAPFFADLRAAGVAPLFRPLHEMNQGVFWWGGRGGPEGTRKLYQITHDYLVKTKGFDHIVWVWDVQDFGTLNGDLDAYDPGPAYYDIAALDIYDGDGYGQEKYDAMVAKAGSKIIAVGECEHPPSAGVLSAQPRWAFFMLWPDFIDENKGMLPGVYGAPQVITEDRMPGWQ